MDIRPEPQIGEGETDEDEVKSPQNNLVENQETKDLQYHEPNLFKKKEDTTQPQLEKQVEAKKDDKIFGFPKLVMLVAFGVLGFVIIGGLIALASR